MSPDELAAMQRTGMVQEGAGGVTHVADPADITSYMSQAKPGTAYVEFSVPTSSLRPTQPGWARIPGPNSMEARLALKRGDSVPQLPTASDIFHKASKTRF